MSWPAESPVAMTDVEDEFKAPLKPLPDVLSLPDDDEDEEEEEDLLGGAEVLQDAPEVSSYMKPVSSSSSSSSSSSATFLPPPPPRAPKRMRERSESSASASSPSTRQGAYTRVLKRRMLQSRSGQKRSREASSDKHDNYGLSVLPPLRTSSLKRYKSGTQAEVESETEQKEEEDEDEEETHAAFVRKHEAIHRAIKRKADASQEADEDEDEKRKRDACHWGKTPGYSWIHLAEGLASHLSSEEDFIKDRDKLMERLDYSTDAMAGMTTNNGDTRVKNIFRDLDSFGVQRTSVQKLFHFWFLQSVLERVYGADWDSSAVRVLKRFGIRNTRSEVLAMTPRRFGKSWSVAMMVAALALNVPGIKITIFSTGKRASGSLMDITMSFLNNIDGAVNRICKQSAEELYIAKDPLPAGKSFNSLYARLVQTRDTTAQIKSLPNSVRGKDPCVRAHFALW